MEKGKPSQTVLSFISEQAFKDAAKKELKKRRQAGKKTSLSEVQKEFAAMTKEKTLRALLKKLKAAAEKNNRARIALSGEALSGEEGLATINHLSFPIYQAATTRILKPGTTSYDPWQVRVEDDEWVEIKDCVIRDMVISSNRGTNGEKSVLTEQGMIGLRFVGCTFEGVSFHGFHDNTSLVGCRLVGCTFTGRRYLGGNSWDRESRIGLYGEVSENHFIKCFFGDVGLLPWSRLGCHGNRVIEPDFNLIENRQFKGWADDAWRYFQATPFSKELGRQVTYSRVGNYLPKASLPKALEYLAGQSNARGAKRGVWVDGGDDFWLVEDSSDGQTMVAWIDRKQYEKLLNLGAIGRDIYGGFKSRRIHEQDRVRALSAIREAAPASPLEHLPPKAEAVPPPRITGQLRHVSKLAVGDVIWDDGRFYEVVSRPKAYESSLWPGRPTRYRFTAVKVWQKEGDDSPVKVGQIRRFDAGAAISYDLAEKT